MSTFATAGPHASAPRDASFNTDLDRPENVLRAIEAMQRRVAREVEPRLSDAARAVGLRRIRLLQLIPAEGVRQTELAARALVSKQALGPVMDSLVSDGLVARSVDPSDARAWLVTLTPDGVRIAESFTAAVGEVMRQLEVEVGAADMAAFVRVLTLFGQGEIERAQ
jgi:DNA-binding MarR family transcriptional regulator